MCAFAIALLRIHQSFIIATEKITAIEANRLIIAGKPIPIGDTFRTALQAHLPLR
ncbi:MAG: LytTR family transcriptional regulator DNA-binding domain-containing protein [Chitinophagales bacterium]|nr:LytTR family transcriptional regulator DNA-binding domain-containing protein [Chitinophagales bacterium]